MANDIGEILSRPSTIRLKSGREIKSAPLDFNDHGDLQAWLDEQQPSAFTAAHREIARGRLVVMDDGTMVRVPYPKDIQQFLLDRALVHDSTRRVELGSPEADRIFDGLRGIVQRLRMSIRKGTPGLTESEITEIVNELDQEARERVLMAAGVMRAGRPKAEGGNGSPETIPMTGDAISTGGNLSASS